MITLYGSQTLQGMILDLALRAKCVEYNAYPELCPFGDATTEPVLVDQGHVIRDPMIISYYLEHRYPAPSLIPNDPIRASVIMMILAGIFEEGASPLKYAQHLADNGPFIAGADPSFADVAVSALNPGIDDGFWGMYRTRLEKSWGSWDNSDG